MNLGGAIKGIVAATVVVLLLPIGCTRGEAIKKDYQEYSIEELMELHLDDSAKVDRIALKAALRKKLEELTLEELKKLEQRIPPSKIAVDFMWPPLAETITPSSLIVHGHVEKVEVTRESLIRNIVERSRDGYELAIDVKVLRQYPEEPQRGTLSLRSVVGHEYTGIVRAGNDYVFTLTESNRKIGHIGVTCAYGLSPDGTVSRIVPGNTSMPLDEAWKLIKSKCDAARGTVAAEDVAAWKAKLAGDDLSACVAALDYLSSVSGLTPEPKTMVEALVRQYHLLRSQTLSTSGRGLTEHARQRCNTFNALASKALDVLLPAREPAIVKTVYDLYTTDIRENLTPLFRNDLGERDGLDVKLVALVGSVPGPERSARIQELLRGRGVVKGVHQQNSYEYVHNRYLTLVKIGEIAGDDITALLLDIARERAQYNIRAGYELSAVWMALAGRGDTTLKAEWEKVAAEDPPCSQYGLRDPRVPETMGIYGREALQKLIETGPDLDALRMHIERYKEGDRNAAFAFAKRVSQSGASEEARRLLLESGVELHDFAGAIASNIPSPEFVPKLVEAAASHTTADVIHALDACGGRHEAVLAAVKKLQSTPEVSNGQNLYEDAMARIACMTFLGEVGDESLADVVRPYVAGKSLKVLYDSYDRVNPKEPPESRYYMVTQLKFRSMVALANCAGQKAKPTLQKVYGELSNDTATRLVAAFALYALGDDAGADLAESYAMRNPDVPLLPVNPVSVRSERTEALVLKRLQEGWTWGDETLFGIAGTAEDAPVRQFLEKHRVELLQLLIMHLESVSADRTASVAEALRMMTGQSFGFDEKGKFVLEPAALNQWREYVATAIKEPAAR